MRATRGTWLVVMAVVLGLGATGCPKKRPVLGPGGSAWAGKMTHAGQDYPFELYVESVDANGGFRGKMVWPTNGTDIARGIRGTATGEVWTFIDDDQDEKVVRVSGNQMTGTDKNGAAALTATRLTP